MDSEQPESLGKILGQNNAEIFSGMIGHGIEIALRASGAGQRLEGNSEIADKADTIADRLALRRILAQSGFVLGDLIASAQDSDVIDVEIIGTKREIE